MSAHESVPGPGAGTVAAVRLRTGGLSSRVVHLIPAADRQAVRTDPVAALCGSLLPPGAVELVALGTGLPCSACLTLRTLTVAPVGPDPARIPGPTPITQRATPAGYAALGWPVSTRGEHVSVRLGTELVAYLVPHELADRTHQVLRDRERPAPVLAHLHLPGQRIVLAQSPFGVPLPLPERVQPVRGSLPLPTGPAARGLVRWVHLPDGHPAGFAREIDLCAALRQLAAIPLTRSNVAPGAAPREPP